MNFQYPPKISLGRLSTPFRPLDNLSKKLGGPRIWIKRDDMTGFATGGNKIRKLEYILADAKAKGCDTLLTQGAFQSNHCVATTLLGVKAGFRASLQMLGDLDLIGTEAMPDSNLFVSRLAGAEVTYYDMDTYVVKLDEILDEKFAALEQCGHKPYKIPAGGTCPLGMWGYIEAAKELKADFEREQVKPRYIVHATGTAGTQAGLTVGNQLYDLGVEEVWGVAVWQDSDFYEEHARKDMRGWKSNFGVDIDIESLAVNTFDQFIGESYAEPDPGVFETIKLVAEHEAFLLDPVYTGRAFHGMLESIRNGTLADASDIVFVHTGGALGLFPQRKKIVFDDSAASIYAGSI